MASKQPAPREPHLQYRLFEFDVDPAWVRKNNENQAEIRRLQVSAALLSLVLIGAGVGILVYSGMEPWGWLAVFGLGTVGVAVAAMIVVIPKKMGSMDHTYSTSELVPAMIADVRSRGITLMALVDQAVDRSRGSIPALTVRSCEKIPGIDSPRVGQRVPAVAVAGNRAHSGGDNTYQFLSPLPIAWGTPKKRVVKAAEEQIPGGEWETLRQNLDRVKEVEGTRTNVLPL